MSHITWLVAVIRTIGSGSSKAAVIRGRHRLVPTTGMDLDGLGAPAYTYTLGAKEVEFVGSATSSGRNGAFGSLEDSLLSR